MAREDRERNFEKALARNLRPDRPADAGTHGCPDAEPVRMRLRLGADDVAKAAGQMRDKRRSKAARWSSCPELLPSNPAPC